MITTLTVNLLAGPGAGKSTTAAGVFAELKQRGFNVELCREWMKDQVWEGREALFESVSQPYILGKQWWALSRLQGRVEAVITDGPIVLSTIYGKDWESLSPLALECHHKLTNLNFLIERSKDYNPRGRLQSEQEAIELDQEVEYRLNLYGLEYTVVSGSDAIQQVTEAVVKQLGQMRILRGSTFQEHLGESHD